MVVVAGLIWLKIRMNGGPYEHDNEFSGSIKKLGNS
jgi:hypothetical protein